MDRSNGPWLSPVEIEKVISRWSLLKMVLAIRRFPSVPSAIAWTSQRWFTPSVLLIVLMVALNPTFSPIYFFKVSLDSGRVTMIFIESVAMINEDKKGSAYINIQIIVISKKKDFHNWGSSGWKCWLQCNFWNTLRWLQTGHYFGRNSELLVHSYINSQYPQDQNLL